MADKQYYWLKMPRDFFKKHYIEILLGMDDGKTLVLFYIWMLTESIDHDGRLRYSDTKPYTSKLLASIAHYPESFVEMALNTFLDLELIEIEGDETIVLPKSLEMIGSESESAQRVRRYRERKEAKRYNVTECNADVTESNAVAESGEDNEPEQEREVITVAKGRGCDDEAMEVIGKWNTLQDVGIKPIARVDKQSKRYKSLVSRIKQYGIEEVLRALENVRNSDFLQGKNNRNWQITFDWFVLPNNFPKVLEGNYNNSSGGGKQSTGNARLDNIKNRVSEVDNW